MSKDAADYNPLVIATDDDGQITISVYRSGEDTVRVDLDKDQALLLLQQLARGLSSRPSQRRGARGKDVFRAYTGPGIEPEGFYPWGRL